MGTESKGFCSVIDTLQDICVLDQGLTPAEPAVLGWRILLGRRKHKHTHYSPAAARSGQQPAHLFGFWEALLAI